VRLALASADPALDRIPELVHNGSNCRIATTLVCSLLSDGVDIMRVVCTGQSGLNKVTFLQHLQQFAQEQGKDVRIYDVGKLLCREAGVDPDAVLNLRLPHLECLDLFSMT